MAADPYRALVVAACVLAVALGGATLPATDHGDVPGSDIEASGPGVPAGTPADPAPGTATAAVETPVGSATAAGTASGGPTATATRTATATPTDTPPPASTDDDADSGAGSTGGSGRLLAVLAILVIVGLVGAVGVAAFGRGGAGSGGGGIAGLGGNLPDVDVSNPFRALAERATAATLTFPSVTLKLTRAIQGAAVGTGSALGSAAGALRAAASVQSRAAGSLLSGLGSASLGLPSLSGILPRMSRREAVGAVPSPSAGADEEEEDDDPLSIPGAWVEMRRIVSPRHRSARTPAEVARIAAEKGLPREPVARLTELFRETAYGGRAHTEEARRAAVLALRSLREEGEE